MVTWTKRRTAAVLVDNINPTWTTATRPASPYTGETGHNTDFSGLETYDGAKWRILSGSWTTATRPSTLVANGSTGFNTDTGMGQEYYDGTNWVVV